MKVDIYNQLVRAGATRRDVLRGAASLAALGAATGTGLGALVGSASAQEDLRAQILQIPGVGKGSPTDADWQKVGELCLALRAGLVVLGSVLLAVTVSPQWLWLTGLMGAHLIQASFTGLCPVVLALKRLGVPSRPAFG